MANEVGQQIARQNAKQATTAPNLHPI